MSTTLQPLSPSGRDNNIDILRGFALAGVLFMFCVSDNGPSYGYTNSLSDEIISWFKYIFIESRMYTMLIIIFGIGFHVQLAKAQKQNESLVPVFSRRIAGLLILGFIHAIILSKRDILMFYGASAIVLLLVRNASIKFLLLFMGILFYVLVPVIQFNVPNAWPKAAALKQPNEYWDYLQYNWQFFQYYHQVYYIYIEMLFYFMLGFIISKAGIYQKIKTNKIFRKRLLIISAIAAVFLIPFWYFWAPANLDRIFSGITDKKIQLLIGFGYRTLYQGWMLLSTTLFAALLIIIQKKKSLTSLAAFGQMSLSNYLIQSIILVPYLLITDKIKGIAPTEGLLTFVLVLTLQLAFSRWWMSKYKMGPFEWLLRSFTYWKWQPMKKNEEHEFTTEKQTITLQNPQYR
ncbi:MAG TPA: DUF418 domain-containing protein [Chitinophagaceae bacterium]